MGFPKYGTFELDDGTNYITERIVGDRASPTRRLFQQETGRREGSKILDDEFTNKVIVVEGRVVATTVSGFAGARDAMKKALGKTEQILQLESDRSYTAITRSLNITQENDEITIGRFSAEFLITDPFAKGAQQVVSLTVVSGTTSQTQTITISGTIFARPLITYRAPDGDGSGPTTTSGVTISHQESGTTLTWSGTTDTSPITYSGSVSFDYDALQVLRDTLVQDFSGFFPVWDVDSNTFTVTFSGTAVGGTIDFSYNPNYL